MIKIRIYRDVLDNLDLEPIGKAVKKRVIEASEIGNLSADCYLEGSQADWFIEEYLSSRARAKLKKGRTAIILLSEERYFTLAGSAI